MDTKTSIEQNLLDSIELIAEKLVDSAGYDKTVKGTIIDCVDQSLGKYKVQYQDSVFYAYAISTEKKYRSGTLVYITIPGSDFSQNKIITGTVDELGTNYVAIVENEDAYEFIGKNCIEGKETFSLCTYKNNKKVLYSKADGIDLIQLNIRDAQEYLSSAESFSIGATFKTSIPAEQKYQGNYGIAFEIGFKDFNNEDVFKTYILDINNMIGTPYNFANETEQSIVYNIKDLKFSQIENIYIFNYDFPKQEEDRQDDIFISELKILGAKRISEEERENYGIIFSTPKGIYFDENDDEDAIRIAQAQVRIQGNIVDSESNYIKYYWFKENNQITSSSEKYNRYGGQGWECLNNYTIISDEESENNIVEWAPGKSDFAVSKKEVAAKENVYKCVTIYMDSVVISKTITFYNYSSIYDISIESTNGTYFFQDTGTTSLICYINGAEQASNFSYSWSVVDSNNTFEILGSNGVTIEQYEKAKEDYEDLLKYIADYHKTREEYQDQINEYLNVINAYENSIQVKGNRVDNLKVNTILNFSVYKCSVYKDGVFIGTSSITIINDPNPDSSNFNYHLTINNGDQLFQYNESGVSPASKAQDKPQTVYPLSFVLYDQEGDDITNNVLNNSIRWIVPKDNTLINISSQYLPYEETEDTVIYRGYKELGFNINNIYSIKKDNNIIKLEIEYDGQIILDKTNFTFIKQGEIGTNGTDFVCRIVPDIAESSAERPELPFVVINTIKNNYKWNYTPKITNRYLRAELWENGEKIADSSDPNVSSLFTFNWTMMKNKHTISISDVSNYSINATTGAITVVNLTDYWDSTYGDPVNLVKCTITYNNKDYSAVMPIVTAWIKTEQAQNYNIDPHLKEGFNNVLYTSGGVTPMYDSDTPFQVSAMDSSHIEVPLACEWHSCGTIYNSSYGEWTATRGLEWRTAMNKDLPSNKKYYKPIEHFNGFCLSNGIYIKTNSGFSIHYPVYMYLNKYSQPTLNGWDGNSIEINNNGGYILAPQVGAGVKNSSNQFTGVFMGQVKDPGKTKAENGLFGYSNGQQTIKLDAETGNATFGVAGKGQIHIDGTSAKITGGDYEYGSSGMEINLQEPSITYGNGNFIVDQWGYLSCKNVTIGDSNNPYDTSTFYGNLQARSGKFGNWDIDEFGFMRSDVTHGGYIYRNWIQSVRDVYGSNTMGYILQRWDSSMTNYIDLFTADFNGNVYCKGWVESKQLKPEEYLTTASGIPETERDCVSILKDGIAFRTNGNDAAWIRFLENPINTGWFEFATGDDATEYIVFSQYNTKNECVRTAYILDQNGNSYLPGNLTVIGQKNRAVEINDGSFVTLGAYENPTPYFGDIGSAKTDKNGYCKIEMEEIFKQTIDYKKTYQVFIQECGEGHLWVKKYENYFEVHGTPNLDFDWELKAPQKGYADNRLEKFEKGEGII